MHHVLEHLQHPLESLINIKKLLKEDGILILEVPNQFFNLKKEVLGKLKVKKYDKTSNPYHHISFFSPNTLMTLIKSSGFEVVEINQERNIQQIKSMRQVLYRKVAKRIDMGISGWIEVVARPKI